MVDLSPFGRQLTDIIYSYKFIAICIIWDTINMYSIQITEVFEDWFTGLKDRMVKCGFRLGLIVLRTATLAIASRWAVA